MEDPWLRRSTAKQHQLDLSVRDSGRRDAQRSPASEPPSPATGAQPQRVSSCGPQLPGASAGRLRIEQLSSKPRGSLGASGPQNPELVFHKVLEENNTGTLTALPSPSECIHFLP